MICKEFRAVRGWRNRGMIYRNAARKQDGTGGLADECCVSGPGRNILVEIHRKPGVFQPIGSSPCPSFPRKYAGILGLGTGHRLAWSLLTNPQGCPLSAWMPNLPVPKRVWRIARRLIMAGPGTPHPIPMDTLAADTRSRSPFRSLRARRWPRNGHPTHPVAQRSRGYPTPLAVLPRNADLIFPGHIAIKIHSPPKIRTDPKVSPRYYN